MMLLKPIFRPNFWCNSTPNHLKIMYPVRGLTYTSLEYGSDSKNPAPFFFSKDVQDVLTCLTQIDYQKVFRRRLFETRILSTPIYKFMTDKELNEARATAAETAKRLLMMPPVLKIREPINEIVTVDPGLKHYDTSNYVITDISYGNDNRNRRILVRDPDGVLKKADWHTRHIINQIYFPIHGREIETPLMFADDHFFEDALKREEYEFILSRACIQFEPDDPEYQKVSSITYQWVDDRRHFNKLVSTRHYGAMAFFLAWFDKVDNLLVDLINRDKINEANGLLWLADKVKLDAPDQLNIERDFWDNNDSLDKIEQHIDLKLPDSPKRNELELALQSYRERKSQELELETGLRRAHGIN